jgi:Uma2 family endonuclease
MAETDWHRDLLLVSIETLQAWFGTVPRVYVSGNLLIFYHPGDKHRHVAPDIFVVRDVPKRQRPNYLIWEEGKAPDLAIEITSASTRQEDLDHKFHLYQDLLKIKEYFLFDPLGDYLSPALQGHRLRGGKYAAIRPVKGRLPSQVLGLHLEQHGRELRFYNPETSAWLPTPQETIAQATAENERLRKELEALRKKSNGK